MPEPAKALRKPEASLLRTLLAMNILYFGIILLAGGYAMMDPTSQTSLTSLVSSAFSPSGALGPLVQAYEQGRLATAAIMTFVVNLLLGSGLAITLASLFIPFGGLFVGIYRAVLWGLLFAPATTPFLWLHVPVLLLEGEAYVVAMLGVWLWWWPVIRQRGQRWSAWKAGLGLQLRIYVAVAALLAASALYEAIEIVYLLPRPA